MGSALYELAITMKKTDAAGNRSRSVRFRAIFFLLIFLCFWKLLLFWKRF